MSLLQKFLLSFTCLSLILCSNGFAAVDWSNEDLADIRASIERELDASLERDFPGIETFTDSERRALFYAFIAQDHELARTLNLRPEDYADRRSGKIDLSEAEQAKLAQVADAALAKTSRELRLKLKELKLPVGLPAKFSIEGAKALLALNLAAFSSLMLSSGAVSDFSDIAAALRTLTFLSAVYIAALPVRLPTVLQKHYEKLEAAKAARATAARTHQIPPAMNRLWFLTRELRYRLSLMQGTPSGAQCRELFQSSRD